MRRSFLLPLLAGVVHGDGSLNVTCPNQAARLTVTQNNAAFYCNGNGTAAGSVGMDQYFQVNVNARNLTLELGSSTVEGLNISAADGLATAPTVVYKMQTLDFQQFSNMDSLKFEGVAFEPDSVELTITDKVEAIRFIETALTDFNLSEYHDSLTYIDLSGTNFTKIPGILYQTNYSTNVNITVGLSSVNGDTSMTTTQYSFLKENAETLKEQPWAKEYTSGCTPSSTAFSPTNLLDPASSSLTVSCTSSTAKNDSSSTSESSDEKRSSSNSGSAEGVDAGDSSGGISTGALVAIIVVVVVIAAVLAFFILRMHLRRKAANANAQNEATATLMNKGDAVGDKGSFISNDEFLRNFRLPQSDVSLVKSVGTGRLWMGEYNGDKVIVKRVESEVTDSFVTKALMAQARSFATISHPNITNLVGITWLAGTDFAVVTEYMDKGNLKTVLSNTDVDLDVSTKLQMCLDVALALAYLHETEQNMCAKKLSSRRVLVNSALSCKLSLFECVPSSTKLGGPSTATTYSYGMGEVAWLAPEVITRSSPMDARKNNMYAFGVLVSEIFTRVSPYQALIEKQGNTMSDVELVKRVRRQEPLVPHENRLAFLEAPASVQQLVEQCLLYAPMSRPTAKDLVTVLHRAKEDLATSSI